MGFAQDLIKPATAWMAKQRSEVVILIAILVAILAGLFRGLPWATGEVKEHIREINASHEKNVATVSLSNERNINTVCSEFNKANERLFNIVQATLKKQGIDIESVPSGSQSFATLSPSPPPPPRIKNND